MLEEAAGISGLHVRRKDAEQKLRAAETNLNRLSTILGDMDARAQSLEKQARQAERYRKLSGEITQAEHRAVSLEQREHCVKEFLFQVRDAGFGAGLQGHGWSWVDRGEITVNQEYHQHSHWLYAISRARRT